MVSEEDNPPLWPGGFFLYNRIIPRPVLFHKKKKQRREIFVKAARGVAFELSSESSFYSTFVIETLIESRLKPHPLCM